MSSQVAIAMHAAGAAIVVVERDAEGDALVTDILPLAFDIDVVESKARELLQALEEPQVVVDAAGVGLVVWQLLFPDERLDHERVVSRERWPDRSPAGVLYQAKGLDRQELVNGLAFDVARQLFHFAPGIPAQDQMLHALVDYDRTVPESGEFGPALVVALALGLRPRFTPPARLGAFLV